MHPFRDQSISRKLKLVILMITAVALLVASAAFVAYDLIVFRRSMASDLATLAKVIGTNSTAALTFDDRGAAKDVLSALAAKQNIVRARIYTSDSELFAEYVRDGESGDLTITVQQQSQVAFTAGYLIASETISLDGETIGTVYLISNLDAFHSRLNRYAGVMGAVLLGSLLVAFILSSKLQSLISDPISHLAETVRAVSVDKDYTIRAVKHSKDEMGLLIDGFNEMLSQIEERDAKLQSARDELERRVEERTKELQDEIAERKQAVELLRRSEEHFRSLIENASDVISIIDRKGAILYESPSVERVLGLKPQTFIGANALDLTHPDDRKSAVALLTAAIGEDGPAGPYELRFEHADGSWRTLEVIGQVVKDESGAVEAIINSRDITERKKQERELLFTNTILNTEHETSLDGILVVGEKGEMISFNKNFVEMWGIPDGVARSRSDSLALQSILDRLESPDKFLDEVKQLYANKEQKLRNELKLKDGRIFDRYSAPMIGADGNYYGRVFYFRDVTEGKRSEAALRESEEKYRTILESIQEGYYEVDLRGHLTFFNDSLCRIVGTPADKLKGLNHREYTDPETARTVFQAFNRVFDTGEPIESLQYQITDKDGVTRFLEVSVSLRRESTGEIVGFRGTIRDVTERQQAEQALRESEERHKTLFESATDSIMVLSTEEGRRGRILAANRAAAEQTGYTVEELLDLNLMDLQTEGQTELTAREFQRIVEGESVSVELLRVRKDGTAFPIEVNAGPLKLGAKTYILNFARDITQRKQIEKEATMLAHAVRSIQEAVCITDANDILLFVNDAFLKAYGYERHEIIGKNIFGLVRLPSNGTLDTLAIPPPNLTKRWEGELLNRRKDGTVFPIHLSTSPIFDETGQTIALVGVTQDITERKHAEQALRESEKRYRALFESNPQAMWVYSTKTLSFLAVNDAAVNGYGYSRKEFLAMSIKDIRPQEDVATLLKSVENAPPGFENAGSWRHRKKDGSIIDVEVSSHGLNFSGLGARLVLATDITERKRATKELRDSELKYRTLFNHIADPVVIFDKASKRFLDCNEAVRRNYGYSVEELRTMSVIDLHPPEDLPNVERYIEVRNPDHPNTYIHVTKDGRRIDVEILTDEIEYQGRPCCISIVRDITQRKRTEDKLLRLATAVEQTGDIIVITDTEGNIQYVNPAFEQATGYSRDEAIGKNPRILKSGDKSADFYKSLWETIKQGSRWSGRFTNKRKDGSLYEEEATISPVRDAGGKVVNYVAVKRDITERRKMEREVTMLAHAIRSIRDTVSITDTNDDIIFVNEAFLQTYGYEREEVIGKNIREIARPADDPRNSGMPLPRDIKAQRWEGELINIRKDGTEFAVQLSASPILDEEGRAIALIGVAQDITERKRFIEELQRAKEAAEAASRAKSEFLANMSHEIRTPMNGIVGMTELALDTELSPEQREYLKLVKLSSDSLLRVINDILDFSKIEAGKLELDYEEFSLQDNVDEVMKALGIRADQKGLELAYYLRPGVPDFIIGDVGRLRQILVNLVGNAIKFTERGEVVVRIDIESRTDDQVVLHFCVRDTGIGVPIEKQAVIFESFTQADGSTTRKYGGTGLGLAISAQLVRAMGGQMWIESPSNCGSPNEDGRAENRQRDSQPEARDTKTAATGPGSMFHFTAAFAVAETSGERAVPSEISTLRGLPVVVVDDNATNRRILEVQLTRWEMKPTTVENAAEALSAIRNAAACNAAFRLALVDLHMPDVDGVELTELIRAMPEAADVKIIMMSSALRENYRKQDLGVDAYLMKPVKASELLGVIRSVLGKGAVSQNGSKRPPAFSSAHPARVLVAEDSEVNQELVKRLLTKWGHSVVIANNGEQAFSLWENERFDIVLMDVQMPELNGFEAAAMIRESERVTGSHIPIIALTAHALKGDRDRCIAAGMDDYLSKPIEAKMLFDVIESALAAAGPANSKGGSRKPTFDADALLRNFDGDVELVRTLAGVFAESSGRQVSEIRNAIASRDCQTVENASHLLKGSVANFRARAAAEAAARLEQMGRASDLSDANAAFGILETELERFKHELTEFVEVNG